MKQVAILFFLISLIGATYARVLYEGVFGTTDAYIVSSKNLPVITPDSSNNIIAFAVGHKIPLANIAAPPFAVFLAAKGYVDYRSKSGISASDFTGVASAFGFFYFGVGEYCERNSVPGFQLNSTDTILQYKNYTQATFLPIETYNTGEIFGATLKESSGLFTLACRASVNDRMDGNISVSAFSVKCDVIVNATNFWLNSTLCPSTQRYIAVSAYLASAATDTTNIKNNTGSDGEGAIYANAKAAFFKYVTNVYVNEVSANRDVTADVLDVVEDFAKLPDSIKDIKHVIFSFLSPKSEGGNVFMWDPTIGIDPSILGSASSMFVSVWMMVAIVIIALLHM